jgi:hypothetical protein
MQAKWADIVFLILGSLSFSTLWWLSARLHNPRFGRFLWDSFFRARALALRMWVFSAETVKAQEAEFIDERPVDFSVFFPWLARVLLLSMYLFVLLAWIILNTNSGNGG